MSHIVCFGEILWDIFPENKKIGGAPLNVALRLAAFGHDVTMISAVGKDALGDKLIAYVKEHHVNVRCIQKFDAHATGSVLVSLNDKGSATYTIEYPRAWDKIETTAQGEKVVKAADAFVFGSLVARDAVSKATLKNYLNLASYKIFDLNLRPPFYSKKLLIELMLASDFIKFNDDELYEVSAYLNSPFRGLEQNLKFIANKTNTPSICVTKGAFGAVLWHQERLFYNSGYKIEVVDTVGAGDAFLGTLISYLLNNEPPQKAIDYGCAVGAMVAQSKGANPSISLLDIERFMG
ncbi:carbohydrate kinase [Tamlana fucoidanivorans]|uniref:Carbohydrate kinase n=1 Tax=Allotamlana fucoidanivorans TaxID=2583814 RepID=A0A5C4SK30_9FLAO|nr:carbohydrate kinase [Tamlana fucoidanivorans]TNJ43509.1 carbohydrate kinase [Tamlana fucoidanivorans]